MKQGAARDRLLASAECLLSSSAETCCGRFTAKESSLFRSTLLAVVVSKRKNQQQKPQKKPGANPADKLAWRCRGGKRPIELKGSRRSAETMEAAKRRFFAVLRGKRLVHDHKVYIYIFFWLRMTKVLVWSSSFRLTQCHLHHFKAMHAGFGNCRMCRANKQRLVKLMEFDNYQSVKSQ